MQVCDELALAPWYSRPQSIERSLCVVEHLLLALPIDYRHTVSDRHKTLIPSDLPEPATPVIFDLKYSCMTHSYFVRDSYCEGVFNDWMNG